MLWIPFAFAADPKPEPAPDDGVKPVFFAGSYGRAQASTDLAGGGGDAVNVVSHPPRLEQGPYLELDLGFKADMPNGTKFDVLITPALAGDLFHYDGDFGNDIGLRNLFAQATHEVATGVPVSVWAGSRMYRGDDIYLLDFWPMDNLNTYGGGVVVSPGNTEIAAQVGVNRLTGDDWQVQDVRVAAADVVSGEQVRVLDRQRTIGSLRLSQKIPIGRVTLRAKAYAELHGLPAGRRAVDDPFQDLTYEDLPPDQGSMVGVQLSAWGWAPQSFVHLWARRSTGLAAYGELAIPSDGLALDERVSSARSWMFASTGNTEFKHFGVMYASYLSYFQDADGQAVDFDDRWEWVGVVRPNVYLGQNWAIGVEASHQLVRPNGLNPRSEQFDVPHITKLSLLPGIQVGHGGYARPRIQLQYTASLLDPAARKFFSPDDARVSPGVQHFVGLGAEWWLNSQRVVTPK
jgi:maltoporin